MSIFRRFPSALASLAPVCAFCWLLTACGSSAPLPEDELFRDASAELEEESYSSAISDYKKLLEEYPFSDKAEIASLNIAYAHYLKEEYPEAVAAFNDFERLYPVSPLLPFVSYNIGMCWLDQAKAADRDPTFSDEALRQFTKVANEFPRTLYADLATFRQQQARENLCEHEIEVGDYYRDRKRYAAAAGRYRYAVSQYSMTESAARAAARLKEIEVAATDDEQKIKTKEAAELKSGTAAEAAAKKADANVQKADDATLEKIDSEAAAATGTPPDAVPAPAAPAPQ